MNFERLQILKESEKSKVYLAFDVESHRMLVEKHLKGTMEHYEILRSLHHSFLPSIYSVSYQGEETIVIEEYVPGASIADADASEKQLRKWLMELCDVLQFLHSKQIIHRDIKPSNILIGADGHIRLIDFDAARREKPNAESDTRLIGTRGFAPPEQYGFAQTDGRSDIYALGVTFQGLLGESAKKGCWKRILRKCTALEPKRRYRKPRQIAQAIKREEFNRKVLRPILFVVFLIALLISAAFMLEYSQNGELKEVSGDVVTLGKILLSRRYTAFRNTDIKAMRQSDAALEEYHGDIRTAYFQLCALLPSDQAYISTDYSDENGNLLIGGFHYHFDVSIGQINYNDFCGLYSIDTGVPEGYRFIPVEDCADYAPAVMKLYHLSIFDGSWLSLAGHEAH